MLMKNTKGKKEMLFDTHAHLDDKKYDSDRAEVIDYIKKEGVSLLVNVGADMESSETTLQLAKEYDFIYAAVGVHPYDEPDLTEADIARLREMAKDEKVVAIGEIGLDYHYENTDREGQKRGFKMQLELAKELKMPVIIHDRDAHKDTMDILRACNVRDCGGVFHCYAGSVEMAKEILDWGMYIAFGGSLTFKKSVKPKEVAQYVPLDRLVTETDAPYLAPEPQRGRRNDSRYMHFVAELIAQLKGVSYEEVARASYENGKKLFGIKEEA